MDAAKLVKVYVKLKAAEAAIEKEYKEKLSTITDQMDIIEQELLELCKTTGQDGGRTEYGSFTRRVKTRYWTSDWDRMYAFIREHDAPDLLERRIHQGNMNEFLAQHPDAVPVGLNTDSKYTITVYPSR